MRRSQLLLAFAALALVLIIFVRAASSTVRGGAAGGGRFAGAGLDGPVDQGGLLAAVRRTELAEARAVAAEARAAAAEARAAQPTAVAVAAGADGGSAAGRLALGKPDDTETNRKLRAALSAAANSRGEVMLALTNDVMMCTNRKTCWWSGGNILETFLQQARRIGLTNYLIVTLDDETERFCRGFGGVPSLRLELPVPSAQQNSRGANMISTLKYGLLKQALLMGFSILIVDLDLVFLKDPFAHLYRDADIEASTDGFSAGWAQGQMQSIHEPKMGWGAGGLFIQHFTLNVGCAFIRPTPRAVQLMERVADRLSRAAAWDQEVFNREAFLLSHGAYNGTGVAVRVMRYDEFMNSKVFFFSDRRRYFPGKHTEPRDMPVMIHFNYHPDKHKRMLCVIDRYVHNNPSACDSLPAAG